MTKSDVKSHLNHPRLDFIIHNENIDEGRQKTTILPPIEHITGGAKRPALTTDPKTGKRQSLPTLFECGLSVGVPFRLQRRSQARMSNQLQSWERCTPHYPSFPTACPPKPVFSAPMLVPRALLRASMNKDVENTKPRENSNNNLLFEASQALATLAKVADISKSRENLQPRHLSFGHSTIDPTRFPCMYPACCKSFPSRSRLQRHIVVHTGEKPYVCNFDGCERVFSRRDNMMQHYRTHLNKNVQKGT